MKKVLFFVLSLLLLMPLSVSAERNGKGTTKREKITLGGSQREYVSYVPKSLGSKRPLLISCHGMNQDANYQKGMMDLAPIADTAKFVTVFPEGEGKSWDISGKKDINFILKIIDVMVEKYDIDPGCVYLSGFSMGGMFTYHAMNLIADRIAAFAPISGYTMGGVTANPSVRPIPIIHTHGTSDDVVTFSNVKSNLNKWIQHDGCPSSAKVIKNYRGTPHITRHVWGPGNDGVEVVLMEMADKGHWISNDWNVWTADEIWKFCKNYRIDVQWPIVKPQLEPDQKYTSVMEAKGKTFAIVNEEEGKAFFGSGNQNLGYESYETAFDEGNAGYQFKLVQSTVRGGWLLRLITPDGAEYSIWGSPGYLNGYSTQLDCSFILGLNNQNGQDVKNGAVWEIEYVEGKGFSLKNKYTGKYLHDAFSAKYDEPAYFAFCTLKEKTATGIEEVSEELRVKREKFTSASWFTLDGCRLNGQPSQSGIYIKDGRKVVIK